MALDASTLDELDRLAEQATWRNGNSQPRPSVMPLDAYRRGDRFLIHFDLPGVDPSTVDLTVEKNVLQVQAERSWPREEGDEVVVAERPQGTFSRQLFLGEGLDPERIGASYDQGVLTVTIPVAEQAKPRKVEISAGGASGSATIDANSSAA
ncbi:MAG: Hsp20/alpha crystallin family protein [Acidimicrobiales bacterium]